MSLFSTPRTGPYNPLYFLAALGAGGLAVSFFMYPMFLVPHPDTPMVTFDHLWPLIIGGSPLVAGLLLLDVALIVFFAALHLRLLAWNLGQYRAYRTSQAFLNARGTTAEIGVMALPLTLAMSINVLFVLGALLVPQLWSAVEWLFPGSLLAFLAVGVLALRQLTDHLSRVLVHGGLDGTSQNSLSPLLAVFTLAMVAVGLAAPAAMSQVTAVRTVAILLSLFFFSVAVLLALVQLPLGFRAMLARGIQPAASPSLWILIPILTLLGIAWLRLSHGLEHTLGGHGTPPLGFTASVLSLQLFFGLLGWAVMRRNGYFRDTVQGSQGDAGRFALICPGVALFVFGLFFISYGLVKTGLVAPLSPLHLLLLLPFTLVQLKTVQVLFKLSTRLLQRADVPPEVRSAA